MTKNKKTFYLYYRTKAGVERRPKLGDYGSLSLGQARAIAKDLLAQVALGKDPALAARNLKYRPTVTDLWDEFYKHHVVRKKSAREDLRMWSQFLSSRLGKNFVDSVRFIDLTNMMKSLPSTPILANRYLSLLSTMFNFAKTNLRWIEANPCLGVKRYKENKRKRYLTRDEAFKLHTKLLEYYDENPVPATFIFLLLYSGARRNEIQSAKWSYLDGNVLRLPDSKTGAKSIYIPAPAMEALEKLPRYSDKIIGTKFHYTHWDKVRKAAGIPGVRLHDLRHNFASVALGAGFSLAQIGELLGHKSAQTTKRYAHLAEEAAIAAAEATAKRLSEQMGVIGKQGFAAAPTNLVSPQA